MGFGHRVYRAEDPRARHMRAGVEALSREMGEPRWFQILEALVAAMQPYARHGVNVNVDFYAGVVYFLNGIAEDLFVPVFAVGRVPGWTVQVMEQLENNILHPAAHALRRSRAARLRPHRRALTRRRRTARGRPPSVATISSTLAPRERSLSGRAKPCKIGPIARAPPRCWRELVRDVAGVEVGEHQHVGSSRDGARLPSSSSRRRRDSTPRPPAARRRSRAPARERARWRARARPCRHARARRCPWSRTTAARRAVPRAARAGSSRPTRARCRRAPRAIGSAFTAQSAKIRRGSAKQHEEEARRRARNPARGRPSSSPPRSLARSCSRHRRPSRRRRRRCTMRPAWNSGLAARRRATFGFASGRPSR